MRLTRAALLIGLTGSLALTACGSSSKSDNASSGDNATTTTTAKAQDVTADMAAAADANLKSSDFPSGWTSKPHDSSKSDSDKVFDQQIADCLGVPVAEISKEGPANVDSPDFSDPDGNATISSSVSYLASSDLAKSKFTLYNGAKVPQCLGLAFSGVMKDSIQNPKPGTDTLPPGTTVGDAKVDKLSLPSMGDESVAYRLVVPIDVSGQKINLTIDFAVIRKGRVGITTTFQGTNSPVSAADEQKYSAAVVGRVKDA